jgi:hypothetical protein
MDTRFIFSSTYSAWNKLSIHYSTPCVQVTDQSSQWIRRVAPIANIAKKGLIVVAFAIATVATVIFSVFSLPYRLHEIRQLERQGLKEDLEHLSNSERYELYKEITNYIDQQEANKKFPELHWKKKQKYIYKMMCYYARSYKIYGPVLAAWTEALLEEANRSGRKLVFMARDGIPAYKIAKEMMKTEEYKRKYPNLVGEGNIVLASLSRKVVHHAQASDEGKEVFQKYIRQLGIRPEDQIMAVDIGFQGSMIDPIRNMLPDMTIDFHYLISHTPRAEGFIYSQGDERAEQYSQLPKIKSIPYLGAGANLAMHWLEDSHQGVQASPECLVEVDGVVYPNTGIPDQKQYVSPKGSLDYLLRKWAQKAVVKNWKKFSSVDVPAVVKKLDETLNKIVNLDLPLLIKHV